MNLHSLNYADITLNNKVKITRNDLTQLFRFIQSLNNGNLTPEQILILNALFSVNNGGNYLYGDETVYDSVSGYDFVLVIDESGSMKKNDPQDLRKDAAKLFVYLAEVMNKGNRVLVSGFGETTNIYTPMIDITGKTLRRGVEKHHAFTNEDFE